MKIHSFEERLNWSLEARDEEFWDAVYRKAFPNMVKWELVDNIEKQKQGIDRVLYLSNGRTLYIDEKKRSKVYDDILLEYISSDTHNTPGWMEKNLAIDYLAYAFIPIQRCYLFPWPILRRAWQHFKVEWKNEYGAISAMNDRYRTWSIPVPIKVLRLAVTRAHIIDVSKELA